MHVTVYLYLRQLFIPFFKEVSFICDGCHEAHDFKYVGRMYYDAGDGLVYLKVCVKDDAARFYYSLDEHTWFPVGDHVEYSKLSDEYFKERGIERFTGAFVGMCCQDFTGERIYADFDYFLYSAK